MLPLWFFVKCVLVWQISQLSLRWKVSIHRKPNKHFNLFRLFCYVLYFVFVLFLFFLLYSASFIKYVFSSFFSFSILRIPWAGSFYARSSYGFLIFASHDHTSSEWLWHHRVMVKIISLELKRGILAVQKWRPSGDSCRLFEHALQIRYLFS